MMIHWSSRQLWSCCDRCRPEWPFANRCRRNLPRHRPRISLSIIRHRHLHWTLH